MMEIFSRQIYVHTHAHSARAHTDTHVKWDALTRSPTRTHRHWLLWMWVTGPCSPSSVRKQSRSLLCSPTASARRKTTFRHHNNRAFQPLLASNMHKIILTLPNIRQQPPCVAGCNVATRRRRGPGGLRVGEKNRRPTSYYAVQSCAIETVGRTIFQVQ